jgi:hypothetical protein
MRYHIGEDILQRGNSQNLRVGSESDEVKSAGSAVKKSGWKAIPSKR